MSDTYIRRVSHGREIQIDPEVLVWRKKMQRFNRMKREILSLLAAKGWSTDECKAWLNTPSPALRPSSRNPEFKRPRAPKELMNPVSIGQLYPWAKRVLSS